MAVFRESVSMKKHNLDFRKLTIKFLSQIWTKYAPRQEKYPDRVLIGDLTSYGGFLDQSRTKAFLNPILQRLDPELKQLDRERFFTLLRYIALYQAFVDPAYHDKLVSDPNFKYVVSFNHIEEKPSQYRTFKDPNF